MDQSLYRIDPDGELDYDGEARTDKEEEEYQEMIEDLRFELSTYNY